jgi:type IV pilus assembly protein PilA
MLNKLHKLRKERARGDRGFTLIELLVVVVIIGILIAIAIPLYLNYRKGAQDKSAASDVRNAIVTIEQCYSDNNNTYPTAGAAGATSMAFTGCSNVANLSSGNTLIFGAKAGGYVVAGNHAGNGTWYCYDSTVGGSVKLGTTAVAANPTSCP